MYNTIHLNDRLDFQQYQLAVRALNNLGISVAEPEFEEDDFMTAEDLRSIKISREQSKMGMLTDSADVHREAKERLMKRYENFLSPFYPFFNTAIAVFLILASFSFFFHLAVAVFYFMTPSFQYFVKGSEGNKDGMRGYVASIIPKQAVLANDQAMDKGGNPLLIYIGKTWIMMLAYALILIFFATNSMLVLVGPISSLFTSLVGL